MPMQLARPAFAGTCNASMRRRRRRVGPDVSGCTVRWESILWNEVNKAMAGTRVSDLAKELGMSNAEMVQALTELGIAVPGPAALIDSDTAQDLRELYAPEGSTAEAVELPANATVKDLAEALGIAASDLQKKLMDLGVLASINQRVNPEDARKLAASYGRAVKIKVAPKVQGAPTRRKGPATGPQSRPPIVTVMGHVDHGKTTLLDNIRQTNVVSGEYGGITQHIGAYQVEVHVEGESRRITFLDTPGHAAFTAMRARGASVTDIAVLVVAADDGIMPQTQEAIDHARAAEVPIVVAINKMDRPDANPDRIKTQLAEIGLVPREYGGEVECIPISALKGEGIADLLENLVFLADVLDLKADPAAPATGVIVEARLEVGRGAVATALVREGTLRCGDSIVCGLASGKIRAMTDDRGERVNRAAPAMPVEIIGLSQAPQAGDALEVVRDERTARQIAQNRAEAARSVRTSQKTNRVTLESLLSGVAQGEKPELRIVVKGDVQGSVEAVVGLLDTLPMDEVDLRVLRSGVGAITENDVQLAAASGAVIIGFNTRADQQAQAAAEREHIDIRTYQVIYELSSAIERAMKGLLAPVYEEAHLGKAEVRATFRTPRGTIIAGCYVIDGKVVRNANARVRRGRDVVFTGKIDSLKHIKDDVREMATGFECGIVLDGYTDVQEGDVIEAYESRQVERV